MKIDTKTIAFNAIIAAVYGALTILLAPISYGSIQMRISETVFAHLPGVRIYFSKFLFQPYN